MPQPRKRSVAFRVTIAEARRLAAVAHDAGRTQTDVIREMIRALTSHAEATKVKSR